MNDSILIIDSSDDEEPVPKKIKRDNAAKPIKICEIKSLVEKDIVVIDDEEQEVVQQKEKKIEFEKINLKFIDNDLTVTKIEKCIDPLRISNISHDLAKVDTKTNQEITKIENTRKRVQLTPITNENSETNKKFIENNLENLLEPSTSHNENTDNSNVEIQENGVSSTSTSEEKSNKMTEEFVLFLDECRNCECENRYKQLILQKLPKLEEKYNQANEKYIKSSIFKKLLLDNITKMKRKPSDVILFFNEIYKEIGSQKKRTIELTEKEYRNLEKLQKVLKKINKKINELEIADCDFNEESNSSYLMLDRYKKRATLIHKKICSFTHDNPYASRQIYKHLDISCSKYSEINRAVDKLYSRTKQFPSYYDVNRCVRKCVKQNNLIITDSVLTFEINKIFEHVGELLKRRRKLETYEAINSLVEPTEQKEDPELEKLMDERHIENEKRIDVFLEKYSMYQEQGKDPAVSSDSDDSNHESENSSDE